MKVCTKCKQRLPITNFYMDKQKRDGLSSSCKTCKLPYMRTAGLEASRRWKIKNAAHVKMYKQSLRKGRRKPADPQAKRRAKRTWKQRNHAAVIADRAKRRALEHRAIPLWANHFFIQEAYRLAKLRTEMFGFKWHVDHIIPLRSESVCGLHTHDNLQVIPAVINLKKGNRLLEVVP